MKDSNYEGKGMPNNAVLDMVKSVDNGVNLVSAIDDLTSRLYRKEGTNVEKFLEKSVSKEFRDVIIKILLDSGVNLHSRESVGNVLGQVKNKIKGSEKIKVQLSFSPNESFIKKLYTWFKVNVDKAFLLDISVDSSVLGGATVAYKGRYLDLSLQKKIENYLGKHEIQELLHPKVQ